MSLLFQHPQKGKSPKPQVAQPAEVKEEDVAVLAQKELAQVKEALSKATEQSSYFEEMNGHLKATLDGEERKRERDQAGFAEIQKGWDVEREQFQNIVIELQEKMAALEEEAAKLRGLSHAQAKELEEMVGEVSALERLALELQAVHPVARPELTRTLTESSYGQVEVTAAPSSDLRRNSESGIPVDSEKIDGLEEQTIDGEDVEGRTEEEDTSY